MMIAKSKMVSEEVRMRRAGTVVEMFVDTCTVRPRQVSSSGIVDEQ